MIFQVTMFPSSHKGASVSGEVARVIDIIDKSGLPYKVSSMSTSIEGEWSKVMPVIDKARRMLRRRGHDRIYISITIDDRKGARGRLDGKVQSIEKKLKRKVSK